MDGPFPSGRTLVQVGFQLPQGERARVRLQLPVDWPFPTAVVEQVEGATVASAQLPNIRQGGGQNGRPLVMASGPPLKRGDVFALDWEGLPHHPTWPRNAALALGLVLLGAGTWAAATARKPGETTRRRALETEREGLLGELVRLELGRKADDDADGLAARQEVLMRELERTYGELDDDWQAGPAGAGSAA